MKRTAWILLLVVLLTPAGIWGQDLSGSYVYQSPQGPVMLVLQHVQDRVTGTLTGTDGSVNRLDGTFDGMKATGTISVTGGSGWFAAGVLDGGLTLLVAEVDPASGEPDLDSGWRLDFTRSGAAGRPAPGPALPGGGATGGAPAPTPQAPAPSASSPLVQEWMQHLRGKKVTYMDSYSSNDSRGSGGYSNKWEAYLCSDGSFHYRSRSRVSVDVGGMSGGSGGDDSFSGQWRIVEQGGQAILQYQRQELAGTDQGEWVPLSYQDGKTYFGQNRVFVTGENDVCR